MREHVCPKCGAPLTVKDGMFGDSPGLVCLPCNTLWNHPDAAFYSHVVGPRNDVLVVDFKGTEYTPKQED